MRVHVVDPSAYTPPYDHALCTALSDAGAEVELITSKFAHGEAPAADGYVVRELFYRAARGAAGSRLRTAAKLFSHAPDMLRYRRLAADADVVHFQWLPVQWLDAHLLPRRPLVLTAHDLLPREARPGQARAQRRAYDAVDAVVVHSQYGREALIERLGVPSWKVHAIPHGAFTHLARESQRVALPAELRDVEKPVVLFFGLLRPYKGVELLLEAWRGMSDAELWVVGRPRMPVDPLRAHAPPGVRFVQRFVSDAETAACFTRADLVVLPYLRTERYDFSGVLATAMAFGKATVVTDIGGFNEVASAGGARLVPAGDGAALHRALAELLEDARERERLGRAARELADGPYSWSQAAAKTLDLYRALTG